MSAADVCWCLLNPKTRGKVTTHKDPMCTCPHKSASEHPLVRAKSGIGPSDSRDEATAIFLSK